MMLVQLKRYSFLALIAILLTSCFKYEEVEIVDIKKVKLLEFSDKGLVVESEVKIKNPNNFDLSVVNSEFNLSIKNNKLAKASIDGKVKIPSQSNDYHTIVLKSDYKDFAAGALPNMLMLTMGGTNKVPFKVEGFVTGKAYFIKKKVKVSHEGIVPLELF